MADLISYMTYEIATGRLLQRMRSSTIYGVERQCRDGISYVFGHWDRDAYRVVDGEVVPVED